jgi:hypothetical protein
VHRSVRKRTLHNERHLRMKAPDSDSKIDIGNESQLPAQQARVADDDRKGQNTHGGARTDRLNQHIEQQQASERYGIHMFVVAQQVQDQQPPQPGGDADCKARPNDLPRAAAAPSPQAWPRCSSRAITALATTTHNASVKADSRLSKSAILCSVLEVAMAGRTIIELEPPKASRTAVRPDNLDLGRAARSASTVASHIVVCSCATARAITPEGLAPSLAVTKLATAAISASE